MNGALIISRTTVCWNDVVCLPDGSEHRLKKYKEAEYRLIERDLERLRHSGVLLSAEKSCFILVDGSDHKLYVYSHKQHQAFSGTKFSMIRHCYDSVREQDTDLDDCDHQHHDYLLTIFLFKQSSSQDIR